MNSNVIIEEPLGMPAEELLRAFRAEFARRRNAINGYEMIALLNRLEQGVIGRDAYSNQKVICYWKGRSEPRELWFDVDERSIEALLRLRLIESITPRPELVPSGGSVFYGLTERGGRFLALVPSEDKQVDPSSWHLVERETFWTVVVSNDEDQPPSIYPFIAEQQPQAELVLSSFAVERKSEKT